jgi:AraC family transcriptional regulator, transcriptional activator of pobA
MQIECRSTILQMMLEENKAEQKGVEKVFRWYLNILLFDFDRKLHTLSLQENGNGKDEKIILFEKLFEQNYTKQKTPSFYAKKLHITTNYLNKLCHDYRYVSGGELIRKRIAIEAKRLLNPISFSIAEVAFKLGFERPSFLNTFFKNITGTTPENFKKKLSLNEKSNNLSKAN